MRFALTFRKALISAVRRGLLSLETLEVSLRGAHDMSMPMYFRGHCRKRRTQGPPMATDALPARHTAQRRGVSSLPTGSRTSSSVMPGWAMTPFRRPLTHTVSVAASQSRSMPCIHQGQRVS